jgi:hypothetical protein
MTNFRQDIKERLERSKLTELDLEEACCNYVYLQLGVNPCMSLKQYYEMKGVYVNDYSEDSDVNKPLWVEQIYHVMSFIEMTQAVSGMKSTKTARQIDEILAHRKIDEIFRAAAEEPSRVAPD